MTPAKKKSKAVKRPKAKAPARKKASRAKPAKTRKAAAKKTAKKKAKRTAKKAAKKTTRKSPKRAAKKTAKKTAKKAVKKTAKKAPKKSAKATATKSGSKRMIRAKPAASSHPASGERITPATRAVAGSAAPTGTSSLGIRYTCFVCGAKFYDLNRPEPVCPRCDANQNDRPKEPPKPRVRKKGGRRKARGMGPLYDDDDEEVIVADDEGFMEVGLEATLLEKRGGDEDEDAEES